MQEPPPPAPDRYTCPDCPKEGMPYTVETHGSETLIYVRCLGCGLAWTVQRPSAVKPKRPL